MDSTWQQQALAIAREEMDLRTKASTIEGPGLVAIWVEVVRRWYVIEQGGRVWWTNDRSLVEGGEGLGAITEAEEEES